MSDDFVRMDTERRGWLPAGWVPRLLLRRAPLQRPWTARITNAPCDCEPRHGLTEQRAARAALRAHYRGVRAGRCGPEQADVVLLPPDAPAAEQAGEAGSRRRETRRDAAG